MKKATRIFLCMMIVTLLVSCITPAFRGLTFGSASQGGPITFTWGASRSTRIRYVEVLEGTTILGRSDRDVHWYTLSGLVTGREYQLTVRGLDENGRVIRESEVSATPRDVLPPPELIRITALQSPEGDEMEFRWNLGETTDAVRVEVVVEGQAIAEVPYADGSYTVTDIVPGGQFSAMLVAVDASGNRTNGVPYIYLPKERKPFVTVWSIREGGSRGKNLILPISYGIRNFIVDWGDGSSDRFTSGFDDVPVAHNYKEYGEYTVSITGDFRTWAFRTDYPDERYHYHRLK